MITIDNDGPFVAGLAEALAFDVGYTKEGSPHAHGFIALCNLYQRSTLEEIADVLKKGCAIGGWICSFGRRLCIFSWDLGDGYAVC